MEKIGRNALCPCGSGKKYKKCCLEKEQAAGLRKREAANTAPAALDWLAAKFPAEVREAVEDRFYGGLKKAEREALNGLDPKVQELLSVNIGEWLLTDAVFRTGEILTPVKTLLQDPAGPPLSDSGRQWLERLAERPLSLYEIRRVEEGKGVMLVDLLKPGEPARWVCDSVASRSLLRWQVIGARVVVRGEENVFSGALYPIDRNVAVESLAKIRRRTRGEAPGSDPYREKCTSVLITEWLRSLARDSRTSDQPDSGPEGRKLFDLLSACTGWADEPMEELAGKSPREAVKTAAGRRAVLEILKSAELFNTWQVREMEGEYFPFQAIWQQLGLDQEVS